MPVSSSSGEGLRSPSSHSHCKGRATGGRQCLWTHHQHHTCATLTGRDLNLKQSHPDSGVMTGCQGRKCHLVFLALQLHCVAAASPVTEQGAGRTGPEHWGN